MHRVFHLASGVSAERWRRACGAMLGGFAVLCACASGGEAAPAAAPSAGAAPPAAVSPASRLGTDFSAIPGEPPLPAANLTTDGQKAPAGTPPAAAAAPGSVPPVPGVAGPVGPLQEWHGALEMGVGTHNTWNSGVWIESHIIPDKVFLGLGIAVGSGWWGCGPWGWERDPWNRSERDRWRSSP